MILGQNWIPTSKPKNVIPDLIRNPVSSIWKLLNLSSYFSIPEVERRLQAIEKISFIVSWALFENILNELFYVDLWSHKLIFNIAIEYGRELFVSFQFLIKLFLHLNLIKRYFVQYLNKFSDQVFFSDE